jgi:hypothetical protein
MEWHRTVDMNQDAERLIALLAGHANRTGTLTETEWERLIEFTRKSSIAQVLFTYLKSQNISPPLAAAERIRKIHLASVVHNTKFFHELEKILQAFQAEGITTVPLKGAWLFEAADLPPEN